jgi:hypothetical protein
MYVAQLFFTIVSGIVVVVVVVEELDGPAVSELGVRSRKLSNVLSKQR